MNQGKISLFESLRVLLARLIKRRIHFPKRYLGKILLMEDGQKFQVIRHLEINPENGQYISSAVFRVRFKFSSLPLWVNKRLSLIPAPFLMAKTGFRQKIWAVSEDGYFQGIYEWTTKESAEKYAQSFIFKMMTKRSAEGSLSSEVIPETVLSDYVEGLFI